MDFLGLLGAKIPVYDISVQEKWIASFLNYKLKFGKFVDNNLYAKEKIVGYLNPTGGLPFIFCQPLNGNFSYNMRRPQLTTDLGVLAFKMRISCFEKFYLEYKLAGLNFISDKIFYHDYYDRALWITDTSDNLFQIVQWTGKDKIEIPQFFGAIISVKDIKEAQDLFYNLGFDQIVYKGIGSFDDLIPLGKPSDLSVKRLIIRSSKEHPFSRFFNVTEVDLIEVPEHYNRKILDKYSLYFLSKNFYKRPDFFYPQIKVFDNEMLMAMVADINSVNYLNLKAVELRKLKLPKNIIITLEDSHSIPPAKLRFLFRNLI